MDLDEVEIVDRMIPLGGGADSSTADRDQRIRVLPDPFRHHAGELAQPREWPHRAAPIGGKLADSPVRLVDQIEGMNRRGSAVTVEKRLEHTIEKRRLALAVEERQPPLRIVEPQIVEH